MVVLGGVFCRLAAVALGLGRLNAEPEGPALAKENKNTDSFTAGLLDS